MGLHPALELKSFDASGFPCRGLFVKSGCAIRKGERVWWVDCTNDPSLRTFTKQEILNANAAPSSMHYDNAIASDHSISLPPFAISSEPTMKATYSVCSTADASTISSCDEAGSETTSATKDDLRGRTIVSSSEKASKHSIDLREILTTYAYMLDDDCYGSTHDPMEDVSYFYNHSCVANTAYSGDDLIVALCDIGEEEQVVYDYAFTETQDSVHVGMNCQCGTTSCRGTLDFLQYKDPTFIAEHYHHCTTLIQRKMRENGWVHDNVVRRRINRYGTWCFGLFACRPIPRLTPIIIFSGKIVTGKQIENVTHREQEMSLQIDTDLWQIPNNAGIVQNGFNDMESESFETGDFINHSCNPNCGMLDSIRVITMRDVAVDEELTFDYAMTNTGQRNIVAETVECRCGDASAGNSLQCRGVITPLDYQKVGVLHFDFLSPFVREAYVHYTKTVAAGMAHTTIPDETKED
jgi:SET domain